MKSRTIFRLKHLQPVSSLIILMFLTVLLLAACDDKPSPKDVQDSIKTALAATGSTPAPTVDQAKYLGGDLGILNFRDFYPSNPGETIHLVITNPNATSFYSGTCGTVILQRQNGNDWTDIAPAKPCAPSGPRIVQITAFSNPYTADFVFSRQVTRPFDGQSWDIPGTYRVYFIYYLTCPRGSDLLNDCIDAGHLASKEFQIKTGSTNSVQATPGFTVSTNVKIGSTATPK